MNKIAGTIARSVANAANLTSPFIPAPPAAPAITVKPWLIAATAPAEAAPVEEEKAVEAVTVTVVNNGIAGHLQVHGPGCKDITAHRNRGASTWDVQATCLRDIVLDTYQDMLDEDPEATWVEYSGEFRFLPCCPKLPA